MFCPKCGDLELESVTQEKLDYLACVNGCEGVWVTRKALEKYWGKKKFKQKESELEEVSQPSFEENDLLKVDEEPLDFIEDIDKNKIFEEEHFDVAIDAAIEEEDEVEVEEDEVEEDEVEVEEVDLEEEEEDEEVEEINFGEQRGGIRMSFINENGEYDDPVNEAAEGFNETADLIEDEDDDSIEIEEEETFLLSSPISGHPMKRFSYTVKDKIKCSLGECSESESYWIDGSEEVLAIVSEKKHSPKNFAELLAFDRPEEEVFEEEEEDDEEL